MTQHDGVLVEIKWAINPFRGDAFAEAWAPAAEAALDYGATQWALYRSKEGMLDFTQTALFPSVEHFERYWYSEEIAAVRVQAAGYYQVPLLPTFHALVGMGALAPAATDAEG
jgi:cation diffusion facilitator CzcD-associated flavoprotein CzcO